MRPTLLHSIFVFVGVTLLIPSSFAQHLLSFPFNGTNGETPMGGLLADNSGNFYGTTFNGGNPGCPLYGCGLVYQISLSGYRVLYEFTGQNEDGANPIGNLVMDGAGNLYGVTQEGGTGTCSFSIGCGTVFELSPPSHPGGAWSENILYEFQGPSFSDGQNPMAGLVFDSAGNLYGTTFYGGIPQSNNPGFGTVFELSPPSQPGGMWAETILHLFGLIPDAREPAGTLIFDSLGNLYGTGFEGGKYGVGAVFELSPPSQPGGEWTENVLFGFIRAQCGSISAGLVMDSVGALYGVCRAGGPNSTGAIFSLLPPPQPGGAWTLHILHNFSANDGEAAAPMIFASPSLLYGTDGFGLFQIAFSGGSPTYTFLYSLPDPQAPVLLKGNALYGTTSEGGKNCTGQYGCGTVFQLMH